MKKITKKAKKVSVVCKKVPTTYTQTEYLCPTCMVTFMGGSLSSSVTRFKCDCGQELIVERVEIK